MNSLSHEALTCLLDHCGQATLVVDPQTLKILHCNADAAQMLEGEPGQIVGERITRFETGIEDHFFWEEVRTGQSSERQAIEGSLLSLRGRSFSVERRAQKLTLEGQDVLIVHARDISRSRIAEELSARTAALLAATFEATPDGLLVTGAHGEVHNFNRRFAALFGLSPEIGEASTEQDLARELHASLAAPGQWAALSKRIADESDQEIRQRLKLGDGRELECTVSPQRLNEQIVGHVWCFSDITARVHYEAALLAARDAADSANRAKSRFLAAMSHELKTPLNAILGFSDLLALDGHAEQQDSIRLIHQAGRHLLELINQVLELARADAGRIELNPQALCASTFISEACEIVTPLAQQRGIRIEYTPTASPSVFADEIRVRQVLLNLLSNAIKYNRPHGWVKISHREHSEGKVKYLHIAVEDSGVGVSKADSARIFEPFIRAGSAAEEIEGTGLGLALTQRLVHLMGGRIGFESKAGQGSLFWFELPAL